MHQQLWGYKVEEKIYLGLRERRLNITVFIVLDDTMTHHILYDFFGRVIGLMQSPLLDKTHTHTHSLSHSLTHSLTHEDIHTPGGIRSYWPQTADLLRHVTSWESVVITRLAMAKANGGLLWMR
jgi:hypothetical protein